MKTAAALVEISIKAKSYFVDVTFLECFYYFLLLLQCTRAVYSVSYSEFRVLFSMAFNK